MNMTQLEIALGLIGTFEAALVEDRWEIRPHTKNIVGYGRTFAEAVQDVVDKWPGAEPLDQD